MNTAVTTQSQAPPKKTNGHAPEVPLSAKNIPLAAIVPSKTNPRKTFGTEADKELASNIVEHGVLQPILVRPVADGKYEIVAGERRFRASKQAGRETIPAVVRELADDVALEIQIIENLQREDVKPIEEGHGYKQLVAALAKADPKKSADGQGVKRQDIVEQIAKKVGKSGRYVYQRMKLTELHADVVKALEEGKIEASHADLISAIPTAEQAKALTLCFKDEWNSGKQEKVLVSIRDLKSRLIGGSLRDLTEVPWKLNAPFTGVQGTLGSCEGCPSRQGDACASTPCYERKYESLVQIATAPVAKKYKLDKATPILVFQSTYGKPQKIGALRVFDDWKAKDAKAGSCKNVTVAYLPEEKTSKTVCVTGTCSKHFPKPKYYSAPVKSEAQKAKEELAQKQSVAKGLALMLAAGDRCKTSLALLRILLVRSNGLFDDVADAALEVIAKEFAWELPKPVAESHRKYPYDTLSDLLEKHVPKMSESQLCKLTAMLEVGQDVSEYNSHAAAESAKQFGVDTKKVCAQAEKDLKAFLAKQKADAAKLAKLQAQTSAKAESPKAKAAAKAAKAGGK